MKLQNRAVCPTIEEMASFIRNPLFLSFCDEIKTIYAGKRYIEYSSCSWEKGWNIKYKQGSTTLCTIYPREGYFTVMVVMTKKREADIASILETCCEDIQEIYRTTKEGNDQRWLMIDIEDRGRRYEDMKKLIALRAKK